MAIILGPANMALAYSDGACRRMPITHIMACPCGHAEECEPEQLRQGRVWQCPACKAVYGHLYPIGGGRAWITLTAEQIEFHNLLGHANQKDGDG